MKYKKTLGAFLALGMIGMTLVTNPVAYADYPVTPNTGVFTHESISDKAAIVTGVLFASTFAMVALIALAYHTRENEK